MSYHFQPAEFRRKNAGDRLDDHNEMQSIMEAIQARDEEIKAFASKASAEIANTGKIATETKAALDKLSSEGADTLERLRAVEQKLGRRLPDADVKSAGNQFVESDAFKALQEGRSEKARFAYKQAETVTSSTADADGAVGVGIQPMRVPGIVTPQDRVLTIRSLLASGRTTSNAIEYVVERDTNLNADMVEEDPSSPKPQSDVSFAVETASVRTIAHMFKVSKQVMDDLPMLASYIDGRAVYGLRFKEEQQLLEGNSTGQQLSGLLMNATVFDEAKLESGDTKIDILRRAMLQVRLSEYRATGIVLHPKAWADIELLKVSEEDNRYVWSNPRSLAQPGLWGIPVVESLSVSEDRFLVGAFAMAATLWDRQNPTVEVATQHEDDFGHNLLSIRAESRLALTVERPAAFVRGSFDVGESPSAQ